MGEPEANPYRAPATSGAALAQAPTPDELRAFFGDNDDYYFAHWKWREGRTPWFAGFNWAAFFLFFLWSLYRKLWALFLVGWVFLFIVAAWVPPGPARTLLMLGAWLACGFLSNGVYFRRARSVIARFRHDVSDPEERLRRISKKGGTSWLALILGIALFLGPALLPSLEFLPFWLLVAGGVYWLSRRRGMADEALNLRQELRK